VATVVPFRAWRFNLEKVGNIDQVVAPPYDVIGPALHRELHKRSPYNVVRIDLPRSTPEDDDHDNRYTRAAELVRAGKQNDVFVRDKARSVTVVEEMFVGPDGQARIRRGFLALTRLHDFSEQVVFPHEATLSGPKEDRYRLMTETGMSLSPIFMLYSLPKDEIMHAWHHLSGGSPPAAVVHDAAGTIRLWPTADSSFAAVVASKLADRHLLIADGHHRYETALRYRDQMRAAGRGEGPWDYALVYLVNMEDPGVAIFATHRLVKSLDEDEILSLPDTLEAAFEIDAIASDRASAAQAIRSFLSTHDEGPAAFGLYVPALHSAYGLRLRRPDMVVEMVPDHTPAYQQLDVTVLHKLAFEKVLGVTPEDIAAGRHISFAKDWNEAFNRLQSGEFQAGFFMRPTRLQQVREVARAGERMPQKSTYFFPKLPTGLVFFDLNDAL
jgi:uncharacterized protein (DUF1015 family)